VLLVEVRYAACGKNLITSNHKPVTRLRDHLHYVQVVEESYGGQSQQPATSYLFSSSAKQEVTGGYQNGKQNDYGNDYCPVVNYAANHRKQ